MAKRVTKNQSNVISFEEWIWRSPPDARRSRYDAFAALYPEVHLPPFNTFTMTSTGRPLTVWNDPYYGSRTAPVSEVVEHREPVDVEIPLFEFMAPRVQGCEVSVNFMQTKVDHEKWNVTVGPLALEGQQRFSVSTSATFRAGAGERKQIFAPVPGALLCRVNANDFASGAPPRRDVTVVPHAAKGRGKGTQSVAAIKSLPSSPGIEPHWLLLERYMLRGDRSGSVTEYEYTYSRIGELTVGVSASGLPHSVLPSTSGGASVTVSMECSLTLHFWLTGGSNYHLYQTGSNHGIGWTVQS
jgi:hypothetical protein